MQIERYLTEIPPRWWVALGVLILGLVLAYVAGALNRRFLTRAGVSEAIEGTSFERTARDLGTSTVQIISKLSTYFLIALTVIVALTVAEIDYIALFWSKFVVFLPQLFIAILVLIIGVVIGDKVELLVAERLRGVKIPEIGLIPLLAKYSVFYVAVLLALSQIQVATLALIILLGVYAFALVIFSALAFKDLLSAGAAGVYLLLNQPYGIGDEVALGDQRGIVQEVDVFVTRIESDGEEYIVPNNRVFSHGIVRVLQ
jgi:small-conductance mechanosensitive channel